MRNGRTIAAERERPISESERALARQKARRGKILRGLVAMLVVGGLGVMVFVGVIYWIGGSKNESGAAITEREPTAQIIDEAETGIRGSVKEFVANLEQDLAEYGYKMSRAVLPIGKMRQINIYIEGIVGYFKVRTDRGAGVQAEDIYRMLKYLTEQGVTEFEYVDVRTEGKGYWK